MKINKHLFKKLVVSAKDYTVKIKFNKQQYETYLFRHSRDLRTEQSIGWHFEQHFQENLKDILNKIFAINEETTVANMSESLKEKAKEIWSTEYINVLETIEE